MASQHFLSISLSFSVHPLLPHLRDPQTLSANQIFPNKTHHLHRLSFAIPGNPHFSLLQFLHLFSSGLNQKNMDQIKGEIQLCITKIVNISILHCSILSAEHPILCGTSLFLLLVYVFLPSLFYFLLYTFPIVIIIAVAVKFALDHRPCNKNIKQEEKQISTQTSTTPVLEARTKSFNRAHSVRRRREQQCKVEEKDMVSSTTTLSNNDILVDKAALIEDNPKDIREVKVDDNVNNNRIDVSPVVVSKRVVKNGSFKGGYHDGRSSDEDQEEEKKALEWTEDDQRNLTDLGLSEIERNKRLESLIAKRMARKLLSIQVRKTLMNMGNNKHPHIASLLIPKTNADSQISPVPGSAPSVLLPNRNPFDLPYDSHEEKPNLTGDDGLREESVTNQPPKDLMFCRHVSFSQGVHFPCPEEFDKDRPAPFNFSDKQSIRSIPEFSRLRNEPENKRDPNLSPKKAWTRTGTPRANKNEKKGNEEGFLYTNKRVIHRPRDSIDSDMLVEMSETASQLDSADLGLDDDLDIAKPWAASSHLAGVEENESKSREVHEVSEKDVIAVGFARLNPICDDHVSSNEKIDEPEPGLVAEQPVMYPKDDRLAEASGSHSTHNNVINIIEEPGDQEQEKSCPTTTEEKNIMNGVPANNNDNDILDFIKQTYGEVNANEQRSPPTDENHMIAAPNDENQTNASPSDENRTNAAPNDENHTNVSSEDIIEDRNNELIDQNGHNPFAGLSDLIVHRNTDDTNDQQPIIESKEQHETMVEGGPSDSSSSSTPKSSSTMKDGQFDANEGNSETVAYAGPLDSDDEAGPSNAVQETDTGPPLESSSPSPKSVLQKKFSMASISSSDQINMETPQHEQQNEDVITVSPSSQHDIQTIHEPSTHIETRQIPLEETMSSSAADPESVIIGHGSKNEGEGSHNETVKLDRERDDERDSKERNQEATESFQVDKDKSKETTEVKPVEELTYKNEDVNDINGR